MSALPVVDVRSRIVSDTTAAYLPPSGRLGRTRVALVTVIEEEFAAAQDVFGLNENLCGTGYFAAEPAASGVSDVVLMQATDRSNVPVMGGCFGADGGMRPQVIILLGIAGGLCDEDGRGRDGIRPGDVLIADQVGYVEFLKIVPGGPLVRTYAIDHPSVSLRRSVSVPIQKIFRIGDHVRDMEPPHPDHSRSTLAALFRERRSSGDAKSHVQQELLKPYDKALAIHMELIGMGGLFVTVETRFGTIHDTRLSEAFPIWLAP